MMEIKRHCPSCRACSLEFEIKAVEESTTLMEVQAYCDQCHRLFGYEFDLYRAYEDDLVTVARFDPPADDEPDNNPALN